MNKSIKKVEQEEEVAKKANIEAVDELSDIKKFIQKRRLQNKILRKITEELQNNPSTEFKKPKSA
jgi:hypothetical protein